MVRATNESYHTNLAEALHVQHQVTDQEPSATSTSASATGPVPPLPQGQAPTPPQAGTPAASSSGDAARASASGPPALRASSSSFTAGSIGGGRRGSISGRRSSSGAAEVRCTAVTHCSCLHNNPINAAEVIHIRSGTQGGEASGVKANKLVCPSCLPACNACYPSCLPCLQPRPHEIKLDSGRSFAVLRDALDVLLGRIVWPPPPPPEPEADAAPPPPAPEPPKPPASGMRQRGGEGTEALWGAYEDGGMKAMAVTTS